MNTGTGGALAEADPAMGRGLRLDTHGRARMASGGPSTLVFKDHGRQSC